MTQEKTAMGQDELRSIVTEVYGNRGQRKLARDLHKGEVTVSRWLTGFSPVGETEAVLIRLILMLHRRGHNWRRWLNDYFKNPNVALDLEDLLG